MTRDCEELIERGQSPACAEVVTERLRILLLGPRRRAIFTGLSVPPQSAALPGEARHNIRCRDTSGHREAV